MENTYICSSIYLLGKNGQKILEGRVQVSAGGHGQPLAVDMYVVSSNLTREKVQPRHSSYLVDTHLLHCAAHRSVHVGFAALKLVFSVPRPSNTHTPNMLTLGVFSAVSYRN